MTWILSWLSGGILDSIFKGFVQPFINVWLKSKDVDLEKYKQASKDTTALAVAVVDAETKLAQIKGTYVLAVLQWWPFRAILFITLLIACGRFCLIMIDSTWPFVWGCTVKSAHVYGDVCSWDIPAIKGTYGQAELEYILFFIVAKPIDTMISGALGLVSRYLAK